MSLSQDKLGASIWQLKLFHVTSGCWQKENNKPVKNWRVKTTNILFFFLPDKADISVPIHSHLFINENILLTMLQNMVHVSIGLSSQILFYLLLYRCLFCLSVCLCSRICAWYPRRPEQDAEYPGPRVTDTPDYFGDTEILLGESAAQSVQRLPSMARPQLPTPVDH